jgi:hypothetical protein
MLQRCGFCGKWIDWMEACVFAENLSVLVNGSPTGEINIQRGLKQGDPLAPFLFLIVVEGFSGVMRNAVNMGLFKGISVGSTPVEISHLQYADDTLCFGEASVENLWTLKAILRGFEMASGLKVNFWKSGLMGVHVSSTFMEMASSFLNCRLGSIPFKYLGLPVGANPKCESTWDPLVDHLRRRLCSWRNKHISLGGRIVLINSVLNSIPIFHLSFLKLPNKVWKKIVRIQREFLWGGVKGGKKINWVKWSVVCKEKNNGGLGVRDVNLVNLSLLAKWRWRLLQPGRPLWKEVLVARYGSHILLDADWSRHRKPRLMSNWWKDILAIDIAVPGMCWFSDRLVRKIGDGRATSFWNVKWVGNAPLEVAFPRLFSLSNNKDNVVSDFLNANGEWSFSWRRNLFRWEEDLVALVTNLLELVELSMVVDSWRWSVEEDGEFSVKSAYICLSKDLLAEVGEVDGTPVGVLAQIWESPAPSKTVAFSWQLLLDRIATRRNLDIRGLLPQNVPWECVGCVGKVETTTHLFLHCPSAMLVWREVLKWIGVPMVIPPSLSSLFEIVKGYSRKGNIRKGFLLIWHATLWSIWKARNGAIFSSGFFSPRDIVEDIKVLSWKWSLARVKMVPCMFYEWTWDPGDCLLRVSFG